MRPEDLVEIEKIKQTKYRYYRFLDTKQFDRIADLFVEHPTISMADGSVVLDDRDALVTMLRTHLTDPKILTYHRVGQAEIELTSPSTATATWMQDDVAINRNDDSTTIGAAVYDDEFVKVGDEWKYSATGYRRIYEETGPRTGAGLTLIKAMFGAPVG